MADIKVTNVEILYGGKFTDSGFATERNEMRFSYPASADSRFRQTSAVQLPQIAGRDQDNAGEVIESVISLRDAQLDEIKAVITRALATVDFSPEFGPGE